MDNEKRGVGRPTDYEEKFVDQVYKLCLLGSDDKQIADFFDICTSTLNVWKSKYPEFMDSIKRGKQLADATVAASLYHRANGYEHEDVDIKMFEGEIIQTPLIKYYPPDPTSMIFWLKNRQPKLWRDKQEFDINDGMLSENERNARIAVLKSKMGIIEDDNS